MNNVFRKVKDFLVILLATVAMLVIVLLSPHERVMYKIKAAVTQEEASNCGYEFTGYRGDDSVNIAKTQKDLTTEDGFGVVRLNLKADQFEETGIYRGIGKTEPQFTKDKIKVFFSRIMKTYGQFYIVTLEDGSRVAMLIDDKMIDMKTVDMVLTPICIFNNQNNLRDYMGGKEALLQKYGIDSEYYLDAATGFASGDTIPKLRTVQGIVAVLLFGAILFIPSAFSPAKKKSKKKRKKKEKTVKEIAT